MKGGYSGVASPSDLGGRRLTDAESLEFGGQSRSVRLCSSFPRKKALTDKDADEPGCAAGLGAAAEAEKVVTACEGPSRFCRADGQPDDERKKRTGILGGTFNPVHAGHIRHALEVGEALGLERVLLTPAAVPPHKPGTGLLPFAWRVDLIRAAVRNVPLLDVNTLEGELDGPSYTFVSLTAWRERHPDAMPFFLMGVEDFAVLHTWYRGLELPGLARLVVVPRAGSDRELFHAVIERHWPGAVAGAVCTDQPVGVPCPGRESVRLPGGGMCDFLPVPRLDISASFVRKRWLADRDVHGLVPDGTLALLEAHRPDVRRAWAVFTEGAGTIPA